MLQSLIACLSMFVFVIVFHVGPVDDGLVY